MDGIEGLTGGLLMLDRTGIWAWGMEGSRSPINQNTNSSLQDLFLTSRPTISNHLNWNNKPAYKGSIGRCLGISGWVSYPIARQIIGFELNRLPWVWNNKQMKWLIIQTAGGNSNFEIVQKEMTIGTTHNRNIPTLEVLQVDSVPMKLGV